MKPFLVQQPFCPLQGKVVFPGDKSIAHRALILSALATGKTKIKNLPLNDDNLTTLSALKKLDIVINKNISVGGKGLYGLKKPQSPIFLGESGTSFRLLLGVLAGQSFRTTLVAGKSLSRRPMHRVAEPLRKMGAVINGQTGKRANWQTEEYPPITIRGGSLRGITYKMPIASAQVKSAILLAGLYAQGKTTVVEKIKTRDHSERMLKLFKAKIKIQGNKISLQKTHQLVSPGEIYIPGDISSAAFFIVIAAILPKSKLVLQNVGLNPSRLGVVKVLKRMGAKIKVTKSPACPAGRQSHKVTSWEPMGDLIIKSSGLKGTTVTKEEIPTLIDELPVLMVAASLAQGKTIFKGVGELRVKETDRIRSMCENLRKMGAKIKTVRSRGSEDIMITGVKQLRGASVKSFSDHRTAMSMVVAGLNAQGQTKIDDVSCISKSFPSFLKILKTLIK